MKKFKKLNIIEAPRLSAFESDIIDISLIMGGYSCGTYDFCGGEFKRRSCIEYHTGACSSTGSGSYCGHRKGRADQLTKY